MSDQLPAPIDQSDSRPYCKPEIVHELDLETRAGSPLGGDPLVDPLSLDQGSEH